MTDAMEKIVLKVGERIFSTTKHTLQKAACLRVHFSDQPGLGIQPSKDGSYYLDMNGDVFEHILEYLQTATKPLLWDRKEGFDYVMYHKIRKQAAFLGMKDLVSWIDKHSFEEAIAEQTTIRVATHFGTPSGNETIATTGPGSIVKILRSENAQVSQDLYVCGCPTTTVGHSQRHNADRWCQSAKLVRAGDSCLRFVIETKEFKIDFSKAK